MFANYYSLVKCIVDDMHVYFYFDSLPISYWFAKVLYIV